MDRTDRLNTEDMEKNVQELRAKEDELRKNVINSFWMMRNAALLRMKDGVFNSLSTAEVYTLAYVAATQCQHMKVEPFLNRVREELMTLPEDLKAVQDVFDLLDQARGKWIADRRESNPPALAVSASIRRYMGEIIKDEDMLTTWYMMSRVYTCFVSDPPSPYDVAPLGYVRSVMEPFIEEYGEEDVDVHRVLTFLHDAIESSLTYPPN